MLAELFQSRAQWGLSCSPWELGVEDGPCFLVFNLVIAETGILVSDGETLVKYWASVQDRCSSWGLQLNS